MVPTRQPNVKTIKLPPLPSGRVASTAAIDERQRDTRPGHFAVTGPFIKLPEFPSHAVSLRCD
jgi:hypothetical protein